MSKREMPEVERNYTAPNWFMDKSELEITRVNPKQLDRLESFTRSLLQELEEKEADDECDTLREENKQLRKRLEEAEGLLRKWVYEDRNGDDFPDYPVGETDSFLSESQKGE